MIDKTNQTYFNKNPGEWPKLNEVSLYLYIISIYIKLFIDY